MGGSSSLSREQTKLRPGATTVPLKTLETWTSCLTNLPTDEDAETPVCIRPMKTASEARTICAREISGCLPYALPALNNGNIQTDPSNRRLIIGTSLCMRYRLQLLDHQDPYDSSLYYGAARATGCLPHSHRCS